jgi:signal transduction histidine kinase/ligand-binding sensor domain-containing protein
MLAFLASLLIAVPQADSTPRPIKQWLHTRWSVKDGAPPQTYSVVQTTDGYLWLGTSTGPVRFDGVRFVPVVLADTLRNKGVFSLLATRDGSLWVVWFGGTVTRFRDGQTTSFGPSQGLPLAFVLAESSTGMLIAGTAKGLSRFDGGRWTDVGRGWAFPSSQALEVWFDRDDALWVQSEDRVVYLIAGTTRFVIGSSLRPGRQKADFVQTRDGRVWTADFSNSVHTLQRVGESEPRSEVMVSSLSMLVDRKGSLWIGTYHDGIRRIIDPRSIRARRLPRSSPQAEEFTVKDGLLSDVVTGMLEDREGNIWVATTRGLERFREGLFVTAAPSGSPRWRHVVATGDGSVWVLINSHNGLVRIGPRGTDTIKTNFAPLALFEDRSGTRWTVGDSGIYRVVGSRLERVKLRAPNGIQRFTSLTVDREGTLWVYSDRVGLMRARGDSLIQVAPVANPAYPDARLFADSRGRIWLAEEATTAFYENGQLTRIDSKLFSGRVQAFFEDRDGSIWAVGNGGLSKFANGRFHTLAALQPTLGRLALGIAEDHDGAWWLAARNAVVRLPPGEAQRAYADKAHPVSYRRFDEVDGVPGLISNAIKGPMSAATPDGRIWIATDAGVATVDPRKLPSATAPPVLVEALRIDGSEISLSGVVTVPPRPSEVEIDYTSTNLATPEHIVFRYRMEGRDTAWHHVGSRRRAYFTDLAPGKYRFLVTASNSDGIWNERGASITFSVLPAWNQTLAFRAGVVLLIAALGAAAAASIQRRRQLQAQAALKREYEATLAERSRIARDLHDTLLQGFAGVTLQLKTAELALPQHPDVAAETIARVQQLARASMREARERVWDMHEVDLGDEDLSDALLAFAYDRTLGNGIEVIASTAGEKRRLTRSQEDAAFRVGREAIVNAVKHAQARRIEISIDFRTNSLRLEVRDDGRGFSPEAAEQARRLGHYGLSGAKELAKREGGICDVVQRAGGGTVAVLELPIPPINTSRNSGGARATAGYSR